jgi:hypothetical protein
MRRRRPSLPTALHKLYRRRRRVPHRPRRPRLARRRSSEHAGVPRGQKDGVGFHRRLLPARAELGLRVPLHASLSQPAELRHPPNRRFLLARLRLCCRRRSPLPRDLSSSARGCAQEKKPAESGRESRASGSARSSVCTRLRVRRLQGEAVPSRMDRSTRSRR